MEAILQWGINLIVFVQQIHGPALDGIFRAITFLGEEEFYLLLLPLLLWCVNLAFGARLAVLFLLSTYITVGLKDLFQQPRPFDLESSVKLSDAEGYGLPSYHAQSAVIVWGDIAIRVFKTWFWVVAIALMLLIGFSRIYLAVQPRMERRLVRLNLGMQILLALAVPLVLLLIHPTKETTAAMATLAGVGIGLALMQRYVLFSPHGPLWQRAMRFFVGGGVIFALYLGLKAVFPGEESSLYLVFRFLHYWLIGLWISLGAPWLFRLLRLASSSET